MTTSKMSILRKIIKEELLKENPNNDIQHKQSLQYFQSQLNKLDDIASIQVWDSNGHKTNVMGIDLQLLPGFIKIIKKIMSNDPPSTPPNEGW